MTSSLATLPAVGNCQWATDACSWASCSFDHHWTFLGVLTTSSIRCPAPLFLGLTDLSLGACVALGTRPLVRDLSLWRAPIHLPFCLGLGSPVSCVCRLTSYYVYRTLVPDTLCGLLPFPCYAIDLLSYLPLYFMFGTHSPFYLNCHFTEYRERHVSTFRVFHPYIRRIGQPSLSLVFQLVVVSFPSPLVE
ncbi:hypothetical protein EDB92DRAFT_1072371 [Lactarius akahatsu]|uniref:Uncharacterized protein n=1 Tax=Lactarius akahatsu TaxID=416441 RepID=A0AAD4Q949_9AGAM|nr:hypothetical protein EDB92DRAFT_1072371 [Lactarius akahatsu]